MQKPNRSHLRLFFRIISKLVLTTEICAAAVVQNTRFECIILKAIIVRLKDESDEIMGSVATVMASVSCSTRASGSCLRRDINEPLTA